MHRRVLTLIVCPILYESQVPYAYKYNGRVHYILTTSNARAGPSYSMSPGLSSDLLYTFLGTYFCTLRYCEGHHYESYNQDHEMSNNSDQHASLRFFQFLYNKYLRLLFEWQPSHSSNFLKSIITFFIINESVHYSRKYVHPL